MAVHVTLSLLMARQDASKWKVKENKREWVKKGENYTWSAVYTETVESGTIRLPSEFLQSHITKSVGGAVGDI